MQQLRYIAPTLLLSVTSNCHALEWQSTNFQALHGWDYQLGQSERTVFTLEYANKWAYGDNYFFMDASETFGEHPSNYAEISPRLSLSKITGKDFQIGRIQDIYIATNAEFSKNKRTYLAGIGSDIKIPRFTFFKLNAYIRNDSKASGSTFQITPSWKSDFYIQNNKFEFSGFADYSGAEGKTRSLLHTAPKLLLDLGHYWKKPNKAFIGIEHEIWRNKFGIKGIDEDNTQIMMKWVF